MIYSIRFLDCKNVIFASRLLAVSSIANPASTLMGFLTTSPNPDIDGCEHGSLNDHHIHNPHSHMFSFTFAYNMDVSRVYNNIWNDMGGGLRIFAITAMIFGVHGLFWLLVPYGKHAKFLLLPPHPCVGYGNNSIHHALGRSLQPQYEFFISERKYGDTVMAFITFSHMPRFSSWSWAHSCRVCNFGVLIMTSWRAPAGLTAWTQCQVVMVMGWSLTPTLCELDKTNDAAALNVSTFGHNALLYQPADSTSANEVK